MESLDTTNGPRSNRLLATLAPADFKSLESHLDRTVLPSGQTLLKAYAPITHVYFPEQGMVSLVQPLKDGTLVEVGVVGREGMVGASILFGEVNLGIEAMVQMPGTALRLPAKLVLDVVKRNPKFRESLMRFNQTLFMHISQSAACNARHRLTQRLARWLLLARDRADGDKLHLSHEFLSMMLGRRRAGVTNVITKFRTDRLIETGRGTITIIDRSGLEHAACECYRSVKDVAERLLA